SQIVARKANPRLQAWLCDERSLAGACCVAQRAQCGFGLLFERSAGTTGGLLVIDAGYARLAGGLGPLALVQKRLDFLRLSFVVGGLLLADLRDACGRLAGRALSRGSKLGGFGIVVIHGRFTMRNGYGRRAAATAGGESARLLNAIQLLTQEAGA